MCAPSAGPVGSVGLGAQAAGAGLSAGSAYYTALAQKSTLQTQAYIADQNASISEVGAQQELEKGRRAEQQIQVQAENVKGSQRASMAANGVDLTEGTPTDILKSTDYMSEQDIATAKANAARAAFGYRTQAAGYKSQAAFARGGAAGINPGMSAVTSLLGGSGQVASSWYQLTKNSNFNGKAGT